MGKRRQRAKKAKKPVIFCYFCDREFQDLKVLVDHQKAKHFRCHVCNKRMNSTFGLHAHCANVHKEQISE